jgi:hypothetical protein
MPAMQRRRVLRRRSRGYREIETDLAPVTVPKAPRKRLASSWPLAGGVLLVGGGFLLWYFRDDVVTIGIKLGTIVGYYPDPTSRASVYASAINSAAQQTGVPASIIAGIGDRETLWGTSSDLSQPGPGGTGDGGHGLGLMQLDNRYNPISNWTDPTANVLKGAQVYASGYTQLQNAGVDPSILTKAAASAYNAGVSAVLSAINNGADSDSPTTGGNYGADVVGRASKYSG